MILDIQAFGNGAGLVLCGFFAGMVCKYLFEAIHGLRKVG